MKNLFILLSLSLSIISCSTEEISDSKTPNSNADIKTEVNQQRLSVNPVINSNTKIVIKSFTRGFSSSIVVNNKKITRTSTGVVQSSTIIISTSNWNLVKQKFATLNLSNISTYAAPSCASCSDAGLSETLEIVHNGVTYTSQYYDSSNPPSQIKSFLTYIKTLN